MYGGFALLPHSLLIPFDHRVCFSIEYLFITVGKRALTKIHCRRTGDEQLLAAKQFYTVVCMSRIIRRQLFAVHLVGSRPKKRKKKNALNDKSIY